MIKLEIKNLPNGVNYTKDDTWGISANADQCGASENTPVG